MEWVSGSCQTLALIVPDEVFRGSRPICPLYFNSIPLDVGLARLYKRVISYTTRCRMIIDEKTFRQAMSYWATGVSVVTSNFEGRSHGMTVSSFTSISANPPVVCVSLNQQARTHQLVEQSGVFAVTILEEVQGPISDCFAGRIPEEGDRFFGLDTFILETKSPLITGGIAFFDCKVFGKVTFGQNTVFFGEVVAARVSETGRPLLYSNRAYQSLHK